MQEDRVLGISCYENVSASRGIPFQDSALDPIHSYFSGGYIVSYIQVYTLFVGYDVSKLLKRIFSRKNEAHNVWVGTLSFV